MRYIFRILSAAFVIGSCTTAAKADTYKVECLISYRHVDQCEVYVGCDSGANVAWFFFKNDGRSLGEIQPTWSRPANEPETQAYNIARNDIVEDVRESGSGKANVLFGQVDYYNFKDSTGKTLDYLTKCVALKS